MNVTLQRMYREMVRVRAFEEAVLEAHQAGNLPGLLHLSMGSEAVAVGILSQLASDDRFYTGHRAHGHFLAAGASPRALFAELAGRDTGLCRGRGGSMHLASASLGMATGIVGGALPLALGHVLCVPPGAAVVALFGDGAVQAGVFHETLNMAALWRAPVLFVCENNGWVEFSSRMEHTTVEDVASYGALYNMPTRAVDGCRVQDVDSAARELFDRIRGGAGPALLECHVSRIRPHYEGDVRKQYGDRDPIDIVTEDLIAQGASKAELARVRSCELAAAQRLRDDVLATEPWPAERPYADLVFASAG